MKPILASVGNPTRPRKVNRAVRRIIEGYFPKVDRTAPPAQTLGPIACAWIESHVVLGQGDWFGRNMKLLPWMRKFIFHLLELVDEELPDGTPWARYRYTRVLLGMPKGSGKGPLIAALALFFAFGPSQFDGWDEDGKPTTRIRTSPVVQVSAASYKQAGLLFDDVANGARYSTTLGDFADVYQGQVRLKGRDGLVERVHSTINAAEGSRPTIVIKDELHEWQGLAKAQIAQVLDNGLAKRRDSISFSVSTAGPLGGDYNNAVCRKLYEEGVKRFTGELEDDPEFLFFWAETITDYDLDDPIERRKAVLAASPSADAEFFDVDYIVKEYNRVDRGTWERYRLNRWVEGEENWLPRGAWKACEDKTAAPLRQRDDDTGIMGEEVVLAVDGSWSNDATAIVAYSREREYGELLHEWRTPAGYHGTYHVPIAEVEYRLREACTLYDVKEIAADPARFGHSISVLKVDYDLPMSVFAQTPERMVPATAHLYEAILNGVLTQNGDPRLAAALGNAVPKYGTRGVQITKPNDGSKIDSAVALIMAHNRAHFFEKVDEVDAFDLDELLAYEDDDPRFDGVY